MTRGCDRSGRTRRIHGIYQIPLEDALAQFCRLSSKRVWSTRRCYDRDRSRGMVTHYTDRSPPHRSATGAICSKSPDRIQKIYRSYELQDKFREYGNPTQRDQKQYEKVVHISPFVIQDLQS